MDYSVTKSDNSETSSSDSKATNTDTGEYEDMKELEEAAIQQTSAGFTPYLFYMHVAGWSNSIVVVVGIRFLCIPPIPLNMSFPGSAFAQWMHWTGLQRNSET